MAFLVTGAVALAAVLGLLFVDSGRRDQDLAAPPDSVPAPERNRPERERPPRSSATTATTPRPVPAYGIRAVEGFEDLDLLVVTDEGKIWQAPMAGGAFAETVPEGSLREGGFGGAVTAVVDDTIVAGGGWISLPEANLHRANGWVLGVTSSRTVIIHREENAFEERTLDDRLLQQIELPLWPGHWPSGVAGRRLVVGGHSGIYVYDLNRRRTERIAFGHVVAVGTDLVAHITCDERLRCQLAVTSVDGERHAVSDTLDAHGWLRTYARHGSSTARFSPDDSRLLVATRFEDRAVVQFAVLDAATGAVLGLAEYPGVSSGLGFGEPQVAWAPDGRGGVVADFGILVAFERDLASSARVHVEVPRVGYHSIVIAWRAVD